MPKIEEVFNDSERELLSSGLYNLVEVKREAMNTLNASTNRLAARDWQPEDFGIPQILKLIDRLGEED